MALLAIACSDVQGQGAKNRHPGRNVVLQGLERALAQDTPLHVVATIPNLRGRYGTFADVDRDGDADYVATEMVHGREWLEIHRRDASGWRRTAATDKPHNQKHPFRPLVLTDDGHGRAAIVLHTGWPPHLFLFPTDGRGQIVTSRVRSLGSYLPPRLSKSIGVDNCPYRIISVEPARDGAPAVIEGSLADENEAGDERHLHWRIELDKRGIRGTAEELEVFVEAEPIAWRSAPRGVRTPARAPEGSDGTLHPRLRRAVIATEMFDVDNDGTRDVVLLTADFAAHVFPGKRRGRSIGFAEKAGDPVSLAAADVKRMWRVDSRKLAAQPSRWADEHGLTTLACNHDTIRLHVSMADSAPFIVHYERKGRSLVPRIARRRLWGDDHPHSYRRRREVIRDFDGDGVPDALFVVTAKDQNAADGRARSYVGYWRGGGGKPTTLARFPDPVDIPANHNQGLPIDLESVDVQGEDRERYCIYFRPWQVGMFVEVRR